MLLKIELLQDKHSSRVSIIQLVGGNLLSRNSNILWTDFNPHLLSMLVNILTMSKLTIIELVGKLELLVSSIMSSICPVSLILDGRLLDASYNTFFTDMGKDSTAVLQPLVMIHDGLSFLWIYISPHILPEVEHSVWISDFHFSSKMFVWLHFSTQVLTFTSKLLVGSYSSVNS